MAGTRRCGDYFPKETLEQREHFKRQLLANDPRAWDDAFNVTYALVKWGRDSFYGEEGLEDAVQKTVIGAWRNASRWDPNSEFKNWIYTILQRRSMDMQKRRRRNVAKQYLGQIYSSDGDESFSHRGPFEEKFAAPQSKPVDDLLIDERRKRIRNGLEAIDPRYGEAVTVQYGQGELPFWGVCVATNTPRGTLRTYRTKGGKAMRAELEEHVAQI